MVITMTIAPDDEGRRLDRLLRKALPKLPLSALHRLLRKKQVLLDGMPAEASVRPKAGSIITIPKEAAPVSHDSPPAYQPRTPIPILWEGTGVLVLNKPAGLTVHGPASLDTLVRSYLAERLPPSLSFRPGPIHRLDTPTSGIILFSTTLKGAQYFSTLIRERQVKKQYLALVDGKLEAPSRWEDLLIRDRNTGKTRVTENQAVAAQDAETAVFPLATTSRYSLILAAIHTGRTHQIRAQAAFHGHPLAGDRKYGGSFQPGGLLLHAYTLEFPVTEATKGMGLPETLKAPLPDAFRMRIGELFGRSLTQVL
ncbi:MAG: RluA family pseudouridine synthase [Treponema sp.]|jgi:23S rRNA pseudouridine955/2504/2580 synthase|nr:RluA family pseudouridine synthase [Treponema sp.]